MAAMPFGSGHHAEVTRFTQETFYSILHIMVGLNSVDNNPRSLTGLQGLWGVRGCCCLLLLLSAAAPNATFPPTPPGRMKCLTSLITASWKGCQTPAGERSPLVFSCLACRVCVVTLS